MDVKATFYISADAIGNQLQLVVQKIEDVQVDFDVKPEYPLENEELAEYFVKDVLTEVVGEPVFGSFFPIPELFEAGAWIGENPDYLVLYNTD